MNGAESLVRSLLGSGVDTCFANPGTSEIHVVAALDRVPGMRCVLGLAEGVVTGAADGYYRMSDKPACTLLHLGPGLANGLANLHNASKARSGIVNVVGDHPDSHLGLDAPLTSDIAAIAAPVSAWVGRIVSADAVAPSAREAVAQALAGGGRVATLVLPADVAWSDAGDPQPLRPAASPAEATSDHDAPRTPQLVERLRRDGASTLLLLGGRALRDDSSVWAARLAAATGCTLMSEFYAARLQRGAGRVALPRLPYSVDLAVAALKRFRTIVLVDAAPPVAFFAYPGKPGRLWDPETEIVPLVARGAASAEVLRELCEAVGARDATAQNVERMPEGSWRDEPLTPASIGHVLARLIPEQAIVVDEALSTGRGFNAATRQAAPHDWLTSMGGSLGFGLPAAVGAAIAAPGRKVIALEGDGSAMYAPQALWTMVREALDVTVVVMANRSYQILKAELAAFDAAAPMRRNATDVLTIDRPALSWVELARGMGMSAARSDSVLTLRDCLQASLASGGPNLIEAVL